MKTLLMLLGLVALIVAIASFAGSIALVLMARRRSTNAAAVPAPPIPDMPLQQESDRSSVEELVASAATLYVPLPGAAVSYGFIEWLSGPHAGQRADLTADGFTIGREEESADVVIPMPSVSKRHLWVGVRDGEPTIVDEGSTNGTFIGRHGGERVTTRRLAENDIVVVANDAARFRYSKVATK